MAKTKALRDALVLDLTDINGTGIFTTTVGEVSIEPKHARASLSLPAIEVVPSEGGNAEEPDTLGAVSGLSDQEFTLKLTIESATPHDAIQDFIDDVRNALERSTGSNICAVTGVFYVTASDWEKIDTDKQGQQQRATAIVTTTIRYKYTRGSV